jgi:hypothetical protein
MTKTLCEFKLRRLGKHFTEPSDYVQIPFTLSEVRDYWRNKAYWIRTIGQKVVAVQGSPSVPTSLTLILI